MPLEQMTADELMQNIGDKFVGTQEIHDSYGSYEELYQRTEASLSPQQNVDQDWNESDILVSSETFTGEG